MPETIVVSVDPAQIQVKPGEAATATIIIRNRSEEVAHYQLRVEGGQPGWAEVVPDQVSAFPLQEIRAQARLHPPQDAPGAAYLLTVRVISQERPDIEGTARLELNVPAPARPAPIEEPRPTQPTPEPPPVGPAPQIATQIEVMAEPVTDSGLPPPAAQWRLRLRNAGNVLDTFSFSITGIHPGWVNLDPAQVTLKPGEEGTALLTVRPADGTAAGTYPFVVRTFSHLNLNQRTETPLKVEVQPRAGFTLAVSPREAESQGLREFEVSLTSDKSSNTDLWLDLSASDQDNACDYTFEPQRVLLQARQVARSSLRVQPRAVLGPNERRQYAVKVVVTPQESTIPAQSDEVRLAQVGAPPLSLDLQPQVQTADLQTEYSLLAVNPSNVEAVLLLTATDPEAGCEYVFKPARLTLPPRGQAQARLKVKARAYNESETEKSFPFTVSATREGDLVPTAKAEGRFVQKRVKPVTLELIQPIQSSRGSAQYFIRVSNPRPNPVQVWLEAADAADALSFTFKPGMIRLSAGAEGQAALTVRPKDRLLPGEQRRVHQFVVSGKVDGSAISATANGTLAQVGGIGWGKAPAVILRWAGWALKWVVVLAVILLLVTLVLAGMEQVTEGAPQLHQAFDSVLYNPLAQFVLRLPFAQPVRGVVRWIAYVLTLIQTGPR